MGGWLVGWLGFPGLGDDKARSRVFAQAGMKRGGWGTNLGRWVSFYLVPGVVDTVHAGGDELGGFWLVFPGFGQ